MVGALQALEDESGFRAADADCVLGTSAGALVGVAAAAGISPSEMGEHSDRGASVAGGISGPYRASLWPPPLGCGSPRMSVSMLREQRDRSLWALLMGLVPRGVHDTDPIRQAADAVAGADWPRSPALRVVATDYTSGQRVTFGSAGAPPATVGEAVAASCAIPGFFKPVRIGERDYVDGGIHSHSNLDLIAGRDLDLVICLSPMSASTSLPARSMLERLAGARRRRARAVLNAEAGTLRDEGTRVVVLEPDFKDLTEMGANPMARDRAERVLEVARGGVARVLRRLALAALLADAETRPARTTIPLPAR